ncbi:hypothetical protein ACQKJZ_12170 [Sphingomonas sp. NPDC019816]|uniref:hypothetical protein n=1 Tax=Sphingomonas sp. NPDC019816 TaxID=3390679 RepID=UPI003D0142FC
MIPFLLLLAGASGPAGESLKLPRLTTGCTLATCPPVAKRSPYRLAQDNPMPIDSKTRAFANDGTYCAVVGDKYCRSKPRTLLRQPIDR